MKPSVVFPIPPNHVAHWKQTDKGFEVEFLRFLTPGQAKMRASASFDHINRKDAA